jgi:hypothetical protein
MNAKRSEFILWAMEVKKKDVESLMKNEERELFKDFMEDFNTGTGSSPCSVSDEAYAASLCCECVTRACL